MANTVTSETKVLVPTLTMAATLLLGRVAQSQRCRWITASTPSDCLFPLWKCRGPTRRRSLVALTERLQRPCSPLDSALSAPRLARLFKVWTTACFVAESFAGTSTRASSRSRGRRPHLAGPCGEWSRRLSSVSRDLAKYRPEPLRGPVRGAIAAGVGRHRDALESVQQSYAKRSGALGRRS